MGFRVQASEVLHCFALCRGIFISQMLPDRNYVGVIQ